MNSYLSKSAFVAAIIVLGMLQTTLADDTTMRVSFQWPEANPHAITDARLKELVEKARDESEKARAMAEQAEAVAGSLRANLEWDSFQPEIVSDGVTLIGRYSANWSGPGLKVYVGKMRYSYGAELVGSFTFINYPEHSTWGIGVVSPPDFSAMVSFKGEVAAPADIRSRPAQGIAAYKNGDRFSGLYYLYFHDTDAVGVYEDADGSRRFVGQLKTVDHSLQPKEGIVEDASGKLLAVIR